MLLHTHTPRLFSRTQSLLWDKATSDIPKNLTHFNSEYCTVCRDVVDHKGAALVLSSSLKYGKMNTHTQRPTFGQSNCKQGGTQRHAGIPLAFRCQLTRYLLGILKPHNLLWRSGLCEGVSRLFSTLKALNSHFLQGGGGNLGLFFSLSSPGS